MTLIRYVYIMVILIQTHWCESKSVLLNNDESVNNHITSDDAESNYGLDEILKNIFYEQCKADNDNNLNPILLYFYCRNYLKSENFNENKERKRRGLLSGYSYTKPSIDESIEGIESDTPPPSAEESIEETYPYPPPNYSKEEITSDTNYFPIHESINGEPSKTLSSVVQIDESKDIKISKELLDIVEKQINEYESSKQHGRPSSAPFIDHSHADHSAIKIKPHDHSHEDQDKKSARDVKNDDSEVSQKIIPPATSYGVPDTHIGQYLKQSSDALKRFPNTSQASDAKPNNLINSSYGVPLSSVKDLPKNEDSKPTRAIKSASTEYPPFIPSSNKHARDVDEIKITPPGTDFGVPDSGIKLALEQSTNALKHYPNSTRASDAKPNDLVKSSYGVPLSSVKDLPKIEDIVQSGSIAIPEKNIKTRFTENFQANDDITKESSDSIDIQKAISSSYELKDDGNLTRDH